MDSRRTIICFVLGFFPPKLKHDKFDKFEPENELSVGPSRHSSGYSLLIIMIKEIHSD